MNSIDKYSDLIAPIGLLYAWNSLRTLSPYVEATWPLRIIIGVAALSAVSAYRDMRAKGVI